MRLYWNDLIFDKDHKALKIPHFNKDVYGWDDICDIIKRHVGCEKYVNGNDAREVDIHTARYILKTPSS